MKRLLLGTLIGALLIIPALSFAGPIVPCAGVDCQGCHLVELGQNIIKFLIEIIAFMGAIVFAIGGLRMVMSKGNSGEVEAAKGMMTDVIVGLVILLAGWLIVDTILKMFVDQGKFIGPWYEIQCVAQPTLGQAPTQSTQVTTGTRPAGSGVQCASGNMSCGVSALKAAGFTDTQANVMSCIAMTESSGDASTPPFNLTHPEIPPGSPKYSTACGLFQVTQTTWNTAASGSCTDFASNCRNAACNTQVAQKLVSRNGYKDWTCPNCNSKAQGCIDKYGG